jgi:hypothetical protein
VDKKSPNTTAEQQQLLVEYIETISSSYFVEATSTSVYSTEYGGNNQFKYWGRYLIPKEILFKPTSKINIKNNNRLNLHTTKNKPLLFKYHTIIPLRI